MVNYTTRVIINLQDIDKRRNQILGAAPTPQDLYVYGKAIAETADRIARMMEVLGAAGFEFTAKKDYIYADSENMEANEVRTMLNASGFMDREYQIYLEYRRQWGVM